MAVNDGKAVIGFLTDPIAFLNSNMIRVRSDLKSAGFGDANRFILVKLNPTSASCQTKSGKACDVYSLAEAGPKDDPVVLAYFLDYQAGKIKHQFLGKKAAVAFTITMDGCTFGVGSKTLAGGVLITHANATGVHKGVKGDEGTSLNIATQKEWTQRDLGADSTLLEPSKYRPAGAQIANTFGLRDSKGWSFYYQAYRRLAKSHPTPYELIGVKPISS